MKNTESKKKNNKNVALGLKPQLMGMVDTFQKGMYPLHHISLHTIQMLVD